MIFIKQFQVRWPWSIGIMKYWLLASSSPEVLYSQDSFPSTFHHWLWETSSGVASVFTAEAHRELSGFKNVQSKTSSRKFRDVEIDQSGFSCLRTGQSQCSSTHAPGYIRCSWDRQVLPSCKQVDMAQFADDTSVFYQSKFRNIPESIRFLQRALNKLSDWFARWNIKINARKTEAIIFRKGGRNVEAPIKIQNCIIPYSSSVKYLGVTLDSKLTFQKHIQNTINKAYGALSILCSFFKAHTLTKRTKVILYMSIVGSMLLYGCEAWSILAACHRKIVKIFQNKCLKIIFDPPRYTRMTELQNVADLPFIDVLLEERVRKMFLKLSDHVNPLVRAMGEPRHRRATYRSIFREVLPEDTEETEQQSAD